MVEPTQGTTNHGLLLLNAMPCYILLLIFHDEQAGEAKQGMKIQTLD